MRFCSHTSIQITHMLARFTLARTWHPQICRRSYCDNRSFINHALSTRPETTGFVGAAAAALLATCGAQADELTLNFKASADPAIRAAQTELVQVYGALPPHRGA